MPATPDKSHLKSLSLSTLEAAVISHGQPRYRAEQILRWIYQKRARSISEMTDLPASLREWLTAEFRFDELALARQTGSHDTTRKLLFRLRDGRFIESVVIPATPAEFGETSSRRTICVSSQVGCAYGCKFCASGLEGWTRNLGSEEIVDQILEAERLTGERIQNIVFMGMGEPLANFENLTRAIEIINSPWGIGLGARHITVSTSGLVPQIRKLAELPLQLRLAISLHGATDEVRAQIMPVNRKYPVDELLDACSYWQSRKKQHITFEYILIDQVNDTLEQAHELSRHALRLSAKVNLIPYNTVEGLPWVRPSIRRQETFLEILRSHRVKATIRREKGHDIDAACGQLRLRHERETGIVSAA
ncbi:MAG TPA: 23S rRNA (adenine(2503)-C(2))-methyltransferase RlmN [Chthoniobacterales bacterium]